MKTRKSRSTRAVGALALVTVALGASACGSETTPPPPPPPPDTTPPAVQIVFPVTPLPGFPESEYDETGDALLDLRLAERVGRLDLPFSPFSEFVFDMEVLDGDAKLYQTLFVEGGIRVIDPATSTELRRVSVSLGGGMGRTDNIVRSPDGSRIYAAVTLGLPRGLAEIDTGTDQAVRRCG